MNIPYDNLSIRNWQVEDRPREKLMEKGRQILSDAELIAILIGSGNDQDSAVSLARKILASVDHNLNKLAMLNVKELQSFRGIGEAKAVSITAALELGRRRKETSSELSAQLLSSKDAFLNLKIEFQDLIHEEFWVIYLNRANRFIKKTCLSKGGISGTIADIRLIFKGALDNLASCIIVAHNHPSGNLLPSKEDILLTSKIKQAGELMDINLMDHLIITASGYYSFADEGKL